MTRLVLAPTRTPENTTFAPGQIVTFAPYYLVNVTARAEVLGLVKDPPFADVPLYHVRLIDALPGRTLPNYTPEGGAGSVYAPLAIGEETTALWHNLTAL